MRYFHYFLVFLLFVGRTYGLKAESKALASSIDAQIHTLLLELDKELSESEQNTNLHQLHVSTIENRLHSRGVSLENQYQIYEQLYNETFAFNFGQSINAVESKLKLAHQIGDSGKIIDSSLDLFLLNTVGGMFLEADKIRDALEVEQMTHNQKIRYYSICQRFCFDYWEFNKSFDKSEALLVDSEHFRQLILDNADKESDLYKATLVQNYIRNADFENALSVNTKLLESNDIESHDYAINAYYQAIILQSLNRHDEATLWFIRSALTDVRLCVKDYASLSCLAQELLEKGDIDRSFNYINHALNDALFYNTKVRQWQIATIFPVIEGSYNTYRKRNEAKTMVMLFVISTLALLILMSAFYLYRMYKKQQVANDKIASMNKTIKEYSDSLEQVNAELQQTNASLLESNAVKEEYIGLFLSICSSYIDKLKSIQSTTRKKLKTGKIDELLSEMSSNDMVEGELRNFYNMFDNAFIHLYPTFVEDFNSLLKPECRIKLKSGEILNTELRIFALIKMGITQSSHIASLLRYSVNTIYNYRAQIKNASLYERENFEEKIKSL